MTVDTSHGPLRDRVYHVCRRRGGGAIVVHTSSDLDVYVVNDTEYRRRVQRFFNGVPTEIFINPPHTIRDYYRDENADGEPITAHILQALDHLCPWVRAAIHPRARDRPDNE